MSDEKKERNIFIENMAILASPEGVQKYILGTKKNGVPRAVYDIVKDYTQPKKKKKNKGKKKGSNDTSSSTYSFYLDTKKGSKKKKKKKNKHWHI